MSTDPVTAISSQTMAQGPASGLPGDRPLNDFSAFDLNVDGGRVMAPPAPGSLPDRSMQIGTVVHSFKDGLKHGFVVPQVDKLLQMSVSPETSPGDMQVQMFEVGIKSSLAGSYLSMSKHLSESINNIVTKQG